MTQAIGIGAISTVIGFAIAAGLFAVGIWQIRVGRNQPRGQFKVALANSTTEGNNHTNQTIPGTGSGGLIDTWVATFVDENGISRSTMPGTVWKVYANKLTLDTSTATLLKVPHGQEPTKYFDSGLQLQLPVSSGPITVTAMYWDAFNRNYTLSMTITPPLPQPTKVK